ncbi:MAG: biopolymer transporter ExbD [Acidobacteriaceae bacterium]
MPMSLSNAKGLHAEPSVTPLIDVLLVLLIIFMVIVPVTPRGFDAMLPQPPKAGQLVPAPTVVVQILASPAGATYKINDENVGSKAQLAAELSRIYAIRAEKVIFVQGDPGLDFASVAEVLDISRAIGIDHVGVLTPGLRPS